MHIIRTLYNERVLQGVLWKNKQSVSCVCVDLLINLHKKSEEQLNLRTI